MPEKTEAEREGILRGVYRSLGWQLGEFCQMRRYTAERAWKFIRYDGLEHYLAARAGQGRAGRDRAPGGVGAFELFHSLMGYPMAMVIRRLDNPRVDRVGEPHSLPAWEPGGPQGRFCAGAVASMRHGETVGILMDTNMTPPQGVFVPFFGVPACTASGLARVAQRTGAAVLPGFLVWEAREKKYVLRFGAELGGRDGR